MYHLKCHARTDEAGYYPAELKYLPGLSFHIAEMLAHPLQAVIEGAADLCGVPDSFNVGPGRAATFEQHFFIFIGAGVAEHFANVAQITIGVDSDVPAVCLADHCVCFLDD